MKIEIMDIAESLSESQKKKFLELTDKVNLHNPKSYAFFDMSKYKKVLEEINDLYDGKINYIRNALAAAKSKVKAELIISEFVKL
jgi:acetylglutamate kinase